MAGDWIKMRSDLFTHPKVVRISSALKADTLRTVGGLMSAWCLFDAHSVDGTLEGYTPDTLDDHLRWPGFAAAMMSIRWLEAADVDGVQSLVLPEFDTHNGQSAKRRAQDADRKQAVRKASASDADKKRTREEKRREDIEATHTLGAGAQAGVAELPAEQARGAVLAAIALKKIGIRIQPQDPTLIALVAENFSVEELVLIAAEKALRDAGLWNDPDTHPELHELLASGATQQQMNLTTEQATKIRAAACAVSIGYIATTLRGRRRDAIDKQGGKPPSRNQRKPSNPDNFEGKNYAGTSVDNLSPELRARVADFLTD